MNTDKEMTCSELQPITGAAVSSDSISTAGLFGADRNRTLRIVADVELSLTGGTASGIVVEVIQATNSALTVGVDVLGSTNVITNGTGGKNVARGARLVDEAFPVVTKPYFGFRYTPQGGTYASGAISTLR